MKFFYSFFSPSYQKQICLILSPTVHSKGRDPACNFTYHHTIPALPVLWNWIKDLDLIIFADITQNKVVDIGSTRIWHEVCHGSRAHPHTVVEFVLRLGCSGDRFRAVFMCVDEFSIFQSTSPCHEVLPLASLTESQQFITRTELEIVGFVGGIRQNNR